MGDTAQSSWHLNIPYIAYTIKERIYFDRDDTYFSICSRQQRWSAMQLSTINYQLSTDDSSHNIDGDR